MKKFIFSLAVMMAAWMGANAMSFERAQAEALYLTDKMAYELNLNEQQYNDAYEINLDYFLRVDSPSDVYGSYYSYRLNDFRCILYDWQYSLLTAADYFLRPILWRAGGWYFPIYSYYNRGYYFYGRPSVWRTYYGGHSRHHYHSGFYVNRRPHWNGGLRGHDMHRPSAGGHHSSPGMGGRGAGRHYSGGSGRSGSHSGVNPGNHGSGSHGSGVNPGNHGSGSHGSGVNPGQHSGSHSGMSRGNSFDGSSSRMGGSRGGSGSSRGSYGSSNGSYGGSRGSYGGSSRGGSPSMGSSRGGGGMSRGGSMGGSRGGSMGGGSRGGGGGSRGGRR